MKKTILFISTICFLLLKHITTYAQTDNMVNISLFSSQSTEVDSAKSIFGLNEVYILISNTLPQEMTSYKINYIRSEFSINGGNWIPIPDISSSDAENNSVPLQPNDTIKSSTYIILFNLFYHENLNMQAFMISGGVIDYRLIFSVSNNEGLSYPLFSPILHIIVPAPTLEDDAALQYIIQQKPNCPELNYFFADIDMSTLGCLYVYEYLSTNFPNSSLGKISKQKIALRYCRNHMADIESHPIIKAEIISTRNLLLDSDIPLLHFLAKKLYCANN